MNMNVKQAPCVEQLNTEIPAERLPWSEITDAERIERLREIVKGMSRSAEHGNRKLCRVEDTVNKHQHGPAGEVLTPAQRHDNYLGGICSGSEKAVLGGEWF